MFDLLENAKEEKNYKWKDYFVNIRKEENLNIVEWYHFQTPN